MSETGLPFTPSPIKGYRLFRQIARFPELLPTMRSTFLDVLVERGALAREDLPGLVTTYMSADGVPDTEAVRAEYTDCIIDLFFANLLSPEEVENWVNLVRKRDRCQELGRVVAAEHTSAAEIWRALREFCDIPKGELYISREEAEGIRVALLSHYISSQLPFIGIAKNHVTIRDIDTVLGHTIGHVAYPGKLGGKSAGMIVAQKILLPILSERDPDFEKYIAVPDTWYISSGVMSDFIDRNQFYGFHTHKYRDRDAIDQEYKAVGGLFEKASFPADVVEEFRSLIRQIGEHPIIVRSSSYLEDSFGLAFSGKYQSIFLANQGGRGAAPVRVHPRGEDGAGQHVRAGPDHLPQGPRPPGLQRAHGHDRAEGGRAAASATGSSPWPPGSCTPPTRGSGTRGSARRTGWCGWSSAWARAPWTGSGETTPA